MGIVREAWEDLSDRWAKRPRPNPKDDGPEANSKDEFFTHLPTVEQTNGIDPFFVRVCAQVAMNTYHHEPRVISKWDQLADVPIAESNGLLKEIPKCLIWNTNGDFLNTNPPFAAVVAGDRLVLAWRGTQTAGDAIRDGSFYLGSSSCWKNVAKVVKVHAGCLAAVEDALVSHEAELLKIIEEHKIKQILLTGHSLGGGICQIAQLWLQGTMDAEIDPTPNKWKDLAKEGLTVKCMSFEGLSTTVYVESEDEKLNQKGKDFINQCGANMCTTAFKSDPVPMLIGHTEDFAMEFVKNVVDTIQNKEKNFFKRGAIDKGIDVLVDFLLNKEKIKDLEEEYFPIAKRYQHIGKVLYYDSVTAEPKVYMDNRNGILVDSEGKKLSLPDIDELEYERNEKDAIGACKWNHGIIIGGPGLSFYHPKDIPYEDYPE